MKKRNLALAFAGAIGAAVAVKMLTRSRTSEWNEDVAHAENSYFVNVDGIKIHFQQFGDEAGPTILLIHGYTASTYVWNTTAPLLADAGFNVIAIDLIGFGYSEKPRWFEYSIESQARMVSRFMDRIGIGRATVVGSSYGGAVAASIALDYPERVEKLVLVDAVCNDGPKNHPLMRLAAFPGIGEALTPFVLDSKRFAFSRMHSTLAPANHHLITQERVDSTVRPLSAADAHHSVLATSRNWHAMRIERDANLINQPTLIIWGEEDTVVPLRDGDSLHRSILNSRFVVIPDCGHVPQEEKTELFSELVGSFCRSKKGKIEGKGDHRFKVAEPLV
ncbi:MAG: alpha/beta hydrolase [Acidobacteriota bacterium]